MNTNGGGHANIGFWLAKTLAAQGHQVTLNVVGDADDAKMQKPPFSYFGELTSAGVRTVWADPGDLASKAGGEQFDVVVDNNGKDLAFGRARRGLRRERKRVQFFFVSSAGMYVPTATPPHLEGDAVKESAATTRWSRCSRPSRSSTSFRPQYFTGYGNNKDCEEWFFDRLVRGRPVPRPGSGDQLGGGARRGRGDDDGGGGGQRRRGRPDLQRRDEPRRDPERHGGDLRESRRRDPTIVNYDVNDMPPGVEVKKAFPFRPIHFYSYPAKALEVLDWKPKHDPRRTWPSGSRSTRRRGARTRRWRSRTTTRSSTTPGADDAGRRFFYL